MLSEYQNMHCVNILLKTAEAYASEYASFKQLRAFILDYGRLD